MAMKPALALATGAAATFAATTIGASPAVAGARPTNVAFVHAVKKVTLHKNGSLTVRAWLRCKPGWAPAELDMSVSQGYASASGYTIPTVPCDDAYRKVRFRLTDVGGTFAVGAGTISAQFLVTNTDSGDSAGAHDSKAANIVTPS